MASWILPKIERWDNFQYIELSQRSFLEESRTAYFFFRDLLTFTPPVTLQSTLWLELCGPILNTKIVIFACWTHYCFHGSFFEVS